MFDWLSNKLRTASKGDGHPLGSAAALREFVDALPKSSPIPCLRAVDEWLQDAHGLAGTLSPDAYRQALSVLDASAQEALQRLWLDLFPQAGGMADDRWALLHTHYGYVQEAYQLALPMFSAGGELSAAERKELALCLLRTLRAMALRHKLNRLRYKAPQESFWQDMLGLYQKARSRNLVTLGMRPYNEDGANTSIQGELLRVLLFEAAPLENLSSEQIECLDRFLCGFLDKAVLRDAPNAQTMFCFEPGKGRGPGRFDPDRPPAGGLFFGPWGAYLEATQALAALDKGQEVAWLQGAPGEGASQLALLRALNFAWSANPPKRIFPREEAAGTMLVVHDFVQVRRMVAASAFARSGRQIEFSASYEFRARIQDEYFGSVDQPNSPPPEVSPDEEQEILTPSEILERLELAGDREQMEIWTAIDRSAEGIGCIVPHQKKWLRVSTVIGYRLPGEIDWQIAVLRRLGRTAEGRRLAGLQLLRGIPAAVYVKAVEGAAHPGQPVAAHALTDFSDGILISAESETLLLDTAEINLDDCLLMVGAGQQQTVVVSEILDQLPGLTVLRYSPASPAA